MDRAYFQNKRPEMLALLPESRHHVLEIGCGEGQFAASIQGAVEIWGVEPEPPAARIAATRLHKVLAEPYETARDTLPPHFFDVIICNDVIEHMVDHDAFLRDIARFLKPGGVLLGSVPNVRYYRTLFDLLVLKDWHYKDSGVLDRTHKRFFTQKSLARSLREAGLRPDLVHGINSNLRLDLRAGQARYSLFGLAAMLLSGFYWRDIGFMQLAFRARPAP